MFSVVVTASNHNPSLLNPDFLQIREIVPRDYELAGSPFSTPPLAVVRYKQGVSITVEIDKLQVVESVAGEFPKSPAAPDIASKYVRTLPHVRYTGVGINWTGFVRQENPGVWISNRFLSKGPWREDPHKLLSTEIRLIYGIGDVRCNLSLADRQVPEGKTLVPVIEVNVNYHHDITDYPGDEAVAGVIAHWHDRLSHFRTLIQDVLGVES